MIKKIADNKNIDYTKETKLSVICQRLKDEGIISLPDWRQIQAWTDIGNEAAHGNNTNCTPQRVSQIIQGLRDIEIKYLK